MKLLFIIGSASQDEQYTISRNSYMITINMNENPKVTQEILNILKIMNFPFMSLDIYHYKYDSNYIQIVELKQYLMQELSCFQNFNNIHPVQAHPVQTHPVQTHPVQTHPMQAHPMQTHPMQTHPMQAHPTEDKTLSSDQEQYLRILMEHMRTNPHPDFGALSYKTTRKCHNYIVSVLGIPNIDIETVEILRKHIHTNLTYK